MILIQCYLVLFPMGVIVKGYKNALIITVALSFQWEIIPKLFIYF